MTPQVLMSKFCTLLEGEKTVLSEKELAFLSELYIHELIQTECLEHHQDRERLYNAFINPDDFYLMTQQEFVEDLTFVSKILRASKIRKEMVNKFLDYVMAPKLQFTGNSQKVHDEIVEKVFEEVYPKKLKSCGKN